MPRRRFQSLDSVAQHPRLESKTYLSSPTQESKRHNQFKEITLEEATVGPHPPPRRSPKRGMGRQSPVGGSSNAALASEEVEDWSHGDSHAEDEDWSMHWDNTYQQYYWLHTSGYSEWVQQDAEQQAFDDNGTGSSGPLNGLGQSSSGVYDDDHAGEENKANQSQAQLKATRSFRRLSLDTKVSRMDSFSPSPSPGFSRLAISALGEEVSTIRGTGEDEDGGIIGDDTESTASHLEWRSINKHQTQRLVQMFGLSPRGHYWPVNGVGQKQTNSSSRTAAGTINDSHRDAESARRGRSLLERALTSPARGPPPLRRAASFNASRSLNVSKVGSLSFAAPSVRSLPRSFANERSHSAAPEGSRSRPPHTTGGEEDDGDDSSFSSPPRNYRSMRVSFGEESTLGRFTADTTQYNAESEKGEEDEEEDGEDEEEGEGMGDLEGGQSP